MNSKIEDLNKKLSGVLKGTIKGTIKGTTITLTAI